jgi:hypothetical protein
MLRFALPVVALAFLAFEVCADEPKAQPVLPGAKPTLTPVNLDELKYAVKVADKRGDNVEPIREALAAFEKSLAKSATKPGETPPELTALREAVETAARKGENVAAISKELGAIEKALTGSAYVRPKPPEPQPEPEPTFPRRGGFNGRGGVVVGGGNGRITINGGMNGGNGALNTTLITISNNQFTIKARQGDVTFIVTGSINGTEAPKITIQDGDKKTETDDLKKVPEAHRPTVERLLGMVQRG